MTCDCETGKLFCLSGENLEQVTTISTSLHRISSPRRLAANGMKLPISHKMIAERIGFLGGGKIAQAMAKGFISSGEDRLF